MKEDNYSMQKCHTKIWKSLQHNITDLEIQWCVDDSFIQNKQKNLKKTEMENTILRDS